MTPTRWIPKLEQINFADSTPQITRTFRSDVTFGARIPCLALPFLDPIDEQ